MLTRAKEMQKSLIPLPSGSIKIVGYVLTEFFLASIFLIDHTVQTF